MDSPPLDPLEFLRQKLGAGSSPAERELLEMWEREGRAVSTAVDRAGTPHLRMFDRLGRRVDEILFVPGYRGLLLSGYHAGAVWRFFEPGGIPDAFRIGFLTAFHDPGLYCPYTVSLATAVAVRKYGSPEIRDRFLAPLLRREGDTWQGATWMTEAGGGSDLGANVATRARRDRKGWELTGEKYFASNVGAELAVVAARLPDAPAGVRGLGLFLVPRLRDDGGLNLLVRRLKPKIATRGVPTGEVVLDGSRAWLLGKEGEGIYHILEVLNLSRTANAVASVALAQRTLAEAEKFARHRVAFGRPIREQPMLAAEFAGCRREIEEGFALAWEAVRLLEEVWEETPPYPERFHLFRLVVHLAKYWTAELAIRTARWSMEVNGGMGVLDEYPVERWLREAMILAVWEGPRHRQVLDGLEVIERQRADRLLWERLGEWLDEEGRGALEKDLEAWLEEPAPGREGRAGELFLRLARATATALHRERSAGAAPGG